MELVKKIDIHVHTDMWGGNELPRQNGDRFATPEELRAFFDKAGIEKGVLLPSVSPEALFAFQSNERTAEIVAKYPDTFVWFMGLDPRMGYNDPNCDFSRIIEHYKKLGARGIAELTVNLPVDCELLDNLFFHAAKCDMPVTIHLAPDDEPLRNYGIMDSLGLPRLERMLKKHPKLKILGHSMMFWSHISGDITREHMNGFPGGRVTEGGATVRLMREYEFLYGDMSAGSGANAVMRDPEFGCRFIEEFQDKLYFGTDICSPKQVSHRLRLPMWLDEMVAAGKISEQAYRKVCRENAVKLLGLDE